MESVSKTMQERIDRFNQKVLNRNLHPLPVGLYHGKMGLCIYFYELAGLTSEKKYHLVADKILNDIVNRMTEDLEIGASNGLTGICMAIHFLLETGYIEGNPNHVLKSYDDQILKSLLSNPVFDSNPNLDKIKPIMESVTYLTTRLQHPVLSKNERQIMQGVTVEMINKFESLHIDTFSEPALFSITEYFTPFYLQLLQRIYRLNFYNYKIEKIIDSLSPHIRSMYPLNQANRLFLCSAMKDIQAIVGNVPGWDKHLELLRQGLDNRQIISEFRNRNIVFGNGLCGFYFLLRKTGIRMEYNDVFIHRIANVEDWDPFFYSDEDLSAPFSLYNGIPGVILTYLHILHKSNATMFFDSVLK